MPTRSKDSGRTLLLLLLLCNEVLSNCAGGLEKEEFELLIWSHERVS